MKKWWGIIGKEQNIQLSEFHDGDSARMRKAYSDESEIDFVIEPFYAEDFQNAKVWIEECLKSSAQIAAIEMTSIMLACSVSEENEQKGIDTEGKTE